MCNVKDEGENENYRADPSHFETGGCILRHDCLLDDTAPADPRKLTFFPITSTKKNKVNFVSERLAQLILIRKHQFQISGCKVAASTNFLWFCTVSPVKF